MRLIQKNLTRPQDVKILKFTQGHIKKTILLDIKKDSNIIENFQTFITVNPWASIIVYKILHTFILTNIHQAIYDQAAVIEQLK